jgi:putative lipoprotein
MLPRTLLSLAALALLSLPATADGNPLADLIGTSWKLAALDGAPVDAKITSTLVVSADSIGGNGGCNTYGGNLAATPDGIDISQVFSTMMACDGLAQEQAFFAALEAADSFAIVDGNLHLLEGDTIVAELTPGT